MIRIIVLLLFGYWPLASYAQLRGDDWHDIPRSEVDTALLTPRAARLLDDPRFSWKHANTRHFVIHYERQMFAAKVARQAEFFYTFIGQDLTSARDRFSQRSHIFVFRDDRDWQHFIQTYGIQTEWAFSLVEGPVMYLQQADTTRSSADVLGHEMTHLVFNRFYEGRLPLWANEGTAEWYGEFAYAAFKGIKKSKRQVFRKLPESYPLELLLVMPSYPLDRRAVQVFYETSKFLVGFLQLQYPQEKFEPFIADLAAGKPVEDALRRHYGLQSVAELETAFKKFVR
ncbi:MAG TPA: hypothetical protein PKE26_05650 [Kiritimatiellia bacterium]|nr:hypothetical protein [Kiritimatiellia bacterium]HMO98577.1 hypothetical protein [Kiritimatiellia bacterium]HMP95444.1 hypothetical protein [Kiritimatiellia bacterium]